MILFIDFETTGLVTQSRDFMAQPGIVQIGAIRLDAHGRELDSMNMLVNPEIAKWEDSAIKTHGITPEKVEKAPTFFEVCPALAHFTLGCKAWAGYNSKFDRDVLWWQLLKYGFERSFPWPPDEIDVMKDATLVMEMQGRRGMKRPKLGEVYEFFFPGKQYAAHDALADIRATADVWRAIEGANHEAENGVRVGGSV